MYMCIHINRVCRNAARKESVRGRAGAGAVVGEGKSKEGRKEGRKQARKNRLVKRQMSKMS